MFWKTTYTATPYSFTAVPTHFRIICTFITYVICWSKCYHTYSYFWKVWKTFWNWNSLIICTEMGAYWKGLNLHLCLNSVKKDGFNVICMLFRCRQNAWPYVNWVLFVLFSHLNHPNLSIFQLICNNGCQENIKINITL